MEKGPAAAMEKVPTMRATSRLSNPRKTSPRCQRSQRAACRHQTVFRPSLVIIAIFNPRATQTILGCVVIFRCGSRWKATSPTIRRPSFHVVWELTFNKSPEVLTSKILLGTRASLSHLKAAFTALRCTGHPIWSAILRTTTTT